MSDIKDIANLGEDLIDTLPGDPKDQINNDDDNGDIDEDGEGTQEGQDDGQGQDGEPKGDDEDKDPDPKPTDPKEGKDTSIFESDDNPYKKKVDELSKRYSDSSRENDLNQKIIKSFKDQAIVPDLNTEITDEIIAKRFPDQDVENMTFMEKEMAKKMIKDEVGQKVQVKQAAEAKFNQDLNEAYKDPLIGDNKQEFLDYLESKIVPGIYPDVQSLAESFAYRKSKANPPAKKQQGKSALEGSGYGAAKGNDKNNLPGKKLSGDAALELSRSNPKKFNEMLIRGEIDMTE